MYRSLAVSALLLVTMAGCTHQKPLQNRIETLEARIVELEAQQAEDWFISDFELNLIDETVKRLKLGPGYGDVAAIDPTGEWRRLVFRGWNQQSEDTDQSVLAPISLTDRYNAIWMWNDPAVVEQIIYTEQITSALLYAPDNFPWVGMPPDAFFVD
ncbi:MAG: hypothetical protein AAGI37_17700 [Planctomycetota bacterium]